jgi:Mrp family chromosome partitioning ATPase
MVVRKAVRMIQELKIPILGIVENMSFFRCPDTGKEHAIFGPSHAESLASDFCLELSARLPIQPEVALLSDAGKVEEVSLLEVAQLAEKLSAGRK